MTLHNMKFKRIILGAFVVVGIIFILLVANVIGISQKCYMTSNDTAQCNFFTSPDYWLEKQPNSWYQTYYINL